MGEAIRLPVMIALFASAPDQRMCAVSWPPARGGTALGSGIGDGLFIADVATNRGLTDKEDNYTYQER